MPPSNQKQQLVANQQGNRVIQKKEVQVEKPSGPHISNTEWGLVIGALAMIDLIQIGLDLLFESGVVLNRFIDVGVGFGLGMYQQFRGLSLGNIKRIVSLLLAFVAEEIPDVDALPFWCLEGVYLMFLYKSEQAVEKNTVVKKTLHAVEKMPSAKNPSNSPLRPQKNDIQKAA